MHSVGVLERPGEDVSAILAAAGAAEASAVWLHQRALGYRATPAGMRQAVGAPAGRDHATAGDRCAAPCRAFRSLKTVDLKVRPVYHRTEPRVRAHVLLCMLAYYVEWHIRRKLKPMLFDDEDVEGAEALRSVVAPATVSPGARAKAGSKRNADDDPVVSG